MTKRLIGSIRVGVLAAAATFCSQSHAITFTLGNNPEPGEENILLNSGGTGTTVQGTGNISGIVVSFSSTTDTLSEPSNGQARIEALDAVLNNVSVSVPGGSFTDLIFNPSITGRNGTSGGTANINVTVNESGGGTSTSPFSYLLGNGNNFLTILAGGGETIASVTIDYTAGFTDLRQIRISGAALATPDGGSTLALLGAAIGALGVARMRVRGS